jgi:outer membrane assembly lipoprotein YfiO
MERQFGTGPVAPGRRSLILIVFALVAATSLVAGCATVPKIPTGETSRIEDARAAFQKEDYTHALLVLKQLLADRPGSRYADEAIFLVGRCYYEQGDYIEAEDRFRRVLREYPDSPFACDASYHLGLALLSQSRPAQLDQTETEAALVQFRSYLSRCRNSELADRAKGHILDIRTKLAEKAYRNGALYKKLGDQKAARFYFREKVLGQYGDTSWGPRAVIAMAQSYKKSKDWTGVATWARKYLDEYPAGDDLGSAQDLLADAREHGATPAEGETPGSPADSSRSAAARP